MKLGVNLINFGPSAGPDVFQQWGRGVEGLGFHSIMISDHIAITKDVATKYPAPFYEPVSTLGWLAGVTEKIEIGTTVMIVPYRNPLETARSLTNIDHLSGGRLIFGVGIGWAEEEFAALNLPFRERGAMTNEYLTAIKKLWTEELVSFDGKYMKFSDVRAAPLPMRKPHPPIWVGGSSDAALRRTVRLGDAWHPIRFDENWLRNDGIPRLRKIADEEGEAMPAICPRIRLRIFDTPLADDDRTMGNGSLDQIRSDLASLEELGCDHVLLDTYYDEVEATRDPVISFGTVTQVAEKLFDLSRGTIR